MNAAELRVLLKSVTRLTPCLKTVLPAHRDNPQRLCAGRHCIDRREPASVTAASTA